MVASTGFDYAEPMQSMVMLVTADGGEGCPGHLAVVLDLDEQGRIARETRYHRIDTLRRCVGEASGDTSTTRWWDSISVPATVAKIQTGVLTLDGNDVAMFNSTPVLEELFVWAVNRFAEAGLASPIVTEVAFYDRRLDMCGGINGFTLGTTVNLCFVEGSTIGNSSEYTDWKLAKSTTLHELGHVWMSARGRGGPVPPEVTERFTEQAGLPTWADTAYVWEDRGVELAASTIAWALTNEPEVHPRFADRFRCSQLGDLFTTLTGKPVPESAQCPDYVAPPPHRGLTRSWLDDVHQRLAVRPARQLGRDQPTGAGQEGRGVAAHVRAAAGRRGCRSARRGVGVSAAQRTGRAGPVDRSLHCQAALGSGVGQRFRDIRAEVFPANPCCFLITTR